MPPVKSSNTMVRAPNSGCRQNHDGWTYRSEEHDSDHERVERGNKIRGSMPQRLGKRLQPEEPHQREEE